jgi:hypothetical protein
MAKPDKPDKPGKPDRPGAHGAKKPRLQLMLSREMAEALLVKAEAQGVSAKQYALTLLAADLGMVLPPDDDDDEEGGVS